MLNRWDEAQAPADPIARRVYASRLLGVERSLVLWGGGNTSVKVRAVDYRGDDVEVLRVKGSGSDLASIEARHFAGIRLDDVRRLRGAAPLDDAAMVDYLTHALLDPGDPRPSIETLLHAFLPQRWVDHTHADAIVAVTNQPDPEASSRRVFGDHVVVVPWVRPGFALGQMTADALDARSGVVGVVLAHHGLITFGDEAHESYSATIELVNRAEEFIADARRGAQRFAGADIAPLSRRTVAAVAAAIRGAMPFPAIVEHEGTPELVAYASDRGLTDAAHRGPATPDHALRVKGWPAVADLDPAEQDEERIASAVRAAVETFTGEYRAYLARSGHAGPEADEHPRVVIVPGIGVFGVGTDAREARIALDIARQTAKVVADATSLGEYRPVEERALYDIEYWPLERYKLTLAPPRRPLAGRVALVTGAASGIGRAVAERLAHEGAVVAVTDIDASGAESVAEAIRIDQREERAALALPLDVSDEGAVCAAFEAVAAAYGGVDILVSNAGTAIVSRVADLSLRDWQRSMDVNATGHFLVAREAVRWMRRQRKAGAVVFVSSKNAFAPGAEFGAYSAAKAAETQLAKILAMEHGADGIRVNIVNPDAVFAGSSLWAPEVRASRAAAHGVPEDELEAFYAKRNLLGARILPEDVADAVAFLVSDAASKITGCTITVDGGVPAAFPR